MDGRNDTEERPNRMCSARTNFNVHFEAPRAEQGLVNHVLSVCHTNDQDVIDRGHSVHFTEHLVDHSVTDARAVLSRSTCDQPAQI